MVELSAMPPTVGKTDTRVGGVEFSELPDWIQHELVIIRVGIALGGDLAAAVFRDYVRSCQPEGKTVSVDRLAAALDSCLELESNPNHKAVAQQVLTWAERMARGVPVDYRAPSLVAEWCHRQIEPFRRSSGRNANTFLKKAAVRLAYTELAKTYPNARGSKKQMYYELQTKFGIERSQLSEMLSGLDPWAHKVPNKIDPWDLSDI